MIRYLLDTNVAVDLIRGRNGLIRDHLVRAGIDACAVCEISVFELLYGAWKSVYRKQNLAFVRSFIRGIDVIPSSHAYDFAAGEKVRLQKEGKRIEDFDLLIGCTAVCDHRILVTNNRKHLSRLTGITLSARTIRFLIS